MRRNISPALLIGLAIGILVLHLAALFYCDHQHRTMAAAVRRAVARQAEEQAAERAAGEPIEEKFPDRNRLQGTEEGPVYWAEFYGETTRSLKYLLSVTVSFLLFSLWFARSARTG